MSRPRVRSRATASAVLLIAAFTLLLAAWSGATPAFSVPDEGAHYLRAIDVGTGHLGGETTFSVGPGLWGVWAARGGTVCNVGTGRPATCTSRVRTLESRATVTSAAGDYPPLSYALPGVAATAASSPLTALRVGRAVSAVICAVALAVAALALADGTATSIMGLVASAAPMVFFIGGGLTSSGLEIAAGIAFFSLLLRFTRGSATPKRDVAAVGGVGLVLALTRSTGALWIVLDLVVLTIYVGPRGLARRIRPTGRTGAAAAAAIVVGIVLNRLWEIVYGSELTTSGTEGTSFVHWLGHGAAQIDRLTHEIVGVFGWLDTPMPTPVYVVAAAVVAAVVATALVVGSRPQRTALATAAAALMGVEILLSATLEASTGTDLQGRHVLPFAVVVPLLAGETVHRNRHRLRTGRVEAATVGCAAVVAAVNVAGWLVFGRREAVGTTGSWVNLLRTPAWSPPHGWWPWLACCVLGAAALALAPLASAHRRGLPVTRSSA